MAVPSDLAERIPEPSSRPSLKPCCPAPSFTSFYRLILATCFSSCSLSPRSLSISLWKGHLADSHSALLTPPPSPQSPDPIFHLPSRAFLVVCPSSEEAGFLSELRRKDCFSCVYTETSRSHRIGLVGWCAFGSTGAHIRFGFQLIWYIISINAALGSLLTQDHRRDLTMFRSTCRLSRRHKPFIPIPATT